MNLYIPASAPHLSTEELANVLKVQPQTIRKRLSQTGSYFCVRPVKLPNRRLMWPADAVNHLFGQCANSAP